MRLASKVIQGHLRLLKRTACYWVEAKSSSYFSIGGNQMSNFVSHVTDIYNIYTYSER